MECAFGMLQIRFEILRRENRRWDVDEIVSITNTCVIIHNMIIRLRQFSGYSDIYEDYKNVHEMLLNESEQLVKSNQELQRNIDKITGEMVHLVQLEADRLFIRDFEITNQHEHIRLQSALLKLNTNRFGWRNN